MTTHDTLQDWLKRRGWSIPQLAGELGVTRQWLYQILAGEQTPGLELATKIERLAGIPASAWIPDRQEAGK